MVLMITSFATLRLQGQDGGNASKPKNRLAHEEVTEKGVTKTFLDNEEKYDIKGNLVEEINYKSGKLDKHMVYEYDNQNKRIKETEVDEAGKVKKYADFKYENGLKSEKLTYDAGGKLLSRKTYTYTYW
jgi:hypothetical protein